MRRVTLSAYFQLLRGILIMFLAAGVTFIGSMAARLASIASEGKALERFFTSFGGFIAIALLIYAMVQIVL